MRRQRLYSSTLLALAACAALAASCGGSDAECSNHGDCGANEICAPDSKTCVANTCGDGVVRGDETCDDGADNSDTRPDACRTDCTAPACGDGVMDPSEQCDEGADNGVSPEPCRADCTLTTCGDGYLGGDEACDGTDLAGATCEDEAGLADGTPACTVACTLDTSPCHTCGNGTLEGPERCDLANLDGRTCAGLGYGGGTLSCSEDCLSLDESWCFTCGDGVCEHEKGETTTACPADCGWVQIASGASSTCGLKADGSAWCWGLNDYGQLGNGTLDSTSIPQRVAFLDDVVKVAPGMFGHACALRSDHTLWCWGWGHRGQLGNGGTLSSSAPVPVWLDLPVQEFAVASWATCALVDDGGQLQAMCWGDNNGTFGDGTGQDSVVPVPVDHGLHRLSYGINHACGIHTTSSQAYCWSSNTYGELGDGTTGSSSTPVQVDPPGGFVVEKISAGGFFSCAVGSDHAAYCWGRNDAGSVGDTTQVERHLPTAVVGISGDVADLSAGRSATCAVTTTGALYCWGTNEHGATGTASLDMRLEAQLVSSVPPIAAVSCAGFSCCAVGVQGGAWCWGQNNFGQTGTGEAGDDLLVPSAVVDPYE